MKRHNHLWEKIISFENLLQASRQAQKGKRFRPNVLAFNYNLENELLQLRDELANQTFSPGSYYTFEIVEPKKRLISAAPYRDRVVHHALCNIIVPIFERTFVAESYANRVGFGTHRALQHFIHFARSSRFVLQCDIQKYFPSIDHEILKAILRRKLRCQKTLWLIDTIIDSSNPQEPVLNYFPEDDLMTPLDRRYGIPIGNLTSQFFANVYLNPLDHFIKETLRVKKYVRFCDDFALFANDQAFLVDAREAIETFLCDYRLKIHPIKSQLFNPKFGTNFLGFRIFPDQIRVRSENLRRARRRIHRLLNQYHREEITWDVIEDSTQSWFAHLEYGNTWHLRQKVSHFLEFRRQ